MPPGKYQELHSRYINRDVDSSTVQQARQLTPHGGTVAYLGKRVVGGSHSHGEDARWEGHTHQTTIAHAADADSVHADGGTGRTWSEAFDLPPDLKLNEVCAHDAQYLNTTSTPVTSV